MWNPNELHDVRVALFGGVGAVRVWVLRTRPAPPFTIALACELEPAGRVGTHVQHDDAEMVIGIEGEGIAIVDEVPHEIVPGSAVGVPLGATLALDNGSPDAPFRYLIIKARARG